MLSGRKRNTALADRENTFWKKFQKVFSFFVRAASVLTQNYTKGYEVMISDETRAYYDLKKRNDVRESAKRLRRQFLRYKDAEIVYSLQHKKLLELASEAGAIYRMDGTVLINRDIFEEYLEKFHEPSTLSSEEDKA